MKRTTIWLDKKDKEAIGMIREKYGAESDSAAIRLALRILAFQKVKIDVGSQNAQDSIEDDP